MELQTSRQANELSALFHHTGGDIELPKPFERDIFLFDTHVAGVMHVEGFEKIESQLMRGDELAFHREPHNAFDAEAIRIETKEGQKIGYIPKKDNIIFARLMDAGKLLFAKIQSKERKGKWTRIEIGVYLKE
ncbi:HIRAN domain-containing protein [Streptococcus sp. H49]|uniref:HIRAN domain-containing protein n=1 Tax=Streptococcus huangxiaojuni TaxID=3237239 RepID=UPI0034A4A48C